MKKIKFRPKGKMFVLLLTIILTVAFVSDSYAKEKKHGAQLVIEKKDGQIIKGELLAAKKNKLILMDSVSLSGITIDMDELIAIRIAKKSTFFQGLGYGLLTGGTTGALIGLLSGDDSSGWFRMTAGEKALIGGLALGILGTPIGGIWGAIKGIDESIILEGKSPEEIKLIQRKLNSKSRFPIELPSNFKIANSIVKKEITEPVEKKVILKKQNKFREKYPQKLSSKKSSRIHFTIEPGYFNSQGIDGFKNIFESIGFGDDDSYSDFFGSGTTSYPDTGKNPVIYLNNIRIELSISKRFALGFTFSPLGKHRVAGHKDINNNYCFSDIFLLGEYEGNVFYLNVAYMSIPDAFLRKSSFKVGTGIGLSTIDLNFKTSEWRYSEGKGDNISLSKNSLGFIAFGEYDYYFNRNWSIGLTADYKYVPIKIEPFQLKGYFLGRDGQNNLIQCSMAIDFPERNVNIGGFGFGINFGFHF